MFISKKKKSKVCSSSIQQVFFKIREINHVSVGTRKWRKPISTLCDHIAIIYFTTTFSHYNSITFRGSFNNTYLSDVKLGMTQLVLQNCNAGAQFTISAYKTQNSTNQSSFLQIHGALEAPYVKIPSLYPPPPPKKGEKEGLSSICYVNELNNGSVATACFHCLKITKQLKMNMRKPKVKNPCSICKKTRESLCPRKQLSLTCLHLMG